MKCSLKTNLFWGGIIIFCMLAMIFAINDLYYLEIYTYWGDCGVGFGRGIIGVFANAGPSDFDIDIGNYGQEPGISPWWFGIVENTLVIPFWILFPILILFWILALNRNKRLIAVQSREFQD